MKKLLLLIMLLLAGCSGTIIGPTATSTLIPPTATFTPPPSPTPAKMPMGPGVEWHLVVLSESTGWGLGAAYASQIEKDVGVKVTVDDFAIGDLGTGDVLQELQTGTSPIPQLKNLPAALANADVVLLFPGPINSLDNDAFISIQTCVGNVMGTPAPCTPAGFEKYTADLEAIWVKVFEYRSGKPTILRGLDDASPFISRWNENQTFNTCNECWETGSAAARKAADAFHIPFLSRYDIFNGANHASDPKQQGYIGSDGIHPNGLAQQYTAELLSKLGYEPVTPP